jgi:chemotaxis protein histidine kinase CheA
MSGRRAQGGSIYIEVADDGRGIDVEAVGERRGVAGSSRRRRSRVSASATSSI